MKNKKNCQVFVSREGEAWGSPIFYNTKYTLSYNTSFSYSWCQKYNTHSLKNDKRIPFWPLTAFLQNSDEKKSIQNVCKIQSNQQFLVEWNQV